MLLRLGFVTATTLIVGLLSVPPNAEPLRRATPDNPFVALAPSRLAPRFDDWRRALRLTTEQDRLFSAMEGHLRQTVEERDAAIVAAAIDRNRELRLPRDPGENLRARAERLSKHAESLRALGNAETSFFESLSDDQRRIAEEILPKDVLGARGLFRRRGMRADGNG